MRTSVKLLLSALAASLLLAAAVGTASASRISVSNQNIRVTWSRLTFEGGAAIVCAVTIEGSFHTRTIEKVARSLIGAITKAIVNRASCTGGTGSTFNGVETYNGRVPANTLPWHVTYESFRGTLPNITAVNILLSRFRFGIEIPGICTGEVGNATDNVTGEAAVGAGGQVTRITPVAGSNRATIIRNGGIFCPATGELNGAGEVFLLGTTTRISVTLI